MNSLIRNYKFAIKQISPKVFRINKKEIPGINICLNFKNCFSTSTNGNEKENSKIRNEYQEEQIIIDIEENKPRLTEEDIRKKKSQLKKEKAVSLSSYFNIKSPKLPPRNLNAHIDKNKLTSNNVAFFDQFDKYEFSKPEEDHLVPVSPHLGPFEVSFI
jgi:hypothetical protein